MGRVLAVCALIVMLSGCAPASPDSGSDFVPSTDGISTEQADEIADGSVTEDEYRAAFERYRACVSDGGYEIIVNGESYDLIDYAIPAEAQDAGVNAPCYDKEFSQVDTMWQLAHADTSQIAELHRNCLIQHGITPKDTDDEMWQQLQDAGLTAEDCGY